MSKIFKVSQVRRVKQAQDTSGITEEFSYFFEELDVEGDSAADIVYTAADMLGRGEDEALQEQLFGLLNQVVSEAAVSADS